MGKKRCRKNYTSKGQRVNIAKVGNDPTPFIDKIIAKQKAWLAGKNPWITVPVDKDFKRVRANDCWGDPRRRFSIYGKPKEEQS